jgi:hypothetical protein
MSRTRVHRRHFLRTMLALGCLSGPHREVFQFFRAAEADIQARARMVELEPWNCRLVLARSPENERLEEYLEEVLNHSICSIAETPAIRSSGGETSKDSS